MTANALRTAGPTPGHGNPPLVEALAGPPLLKSVAPVVDEARTPEERYGADVLDFIVTETTHTVEVTQQRPGLPFTATFTSGETGWYADGYEAEQTTHHEFEQVFRSPLPEVFELVNYWLLTEHRMAVLPHSWQINSLDADNQLSLLGRAAPARTLTQTG